MFKLVEDFVSNFWKHRKVSPLLQVVLRYDEIITNAVVAWFNFLNCKYTNGILISFEIIGSLIWTVLCCGFSIYNSDKIDFVHKNLLLGIFIDMVLTAGVKVIIARKRPINDGGVGAIGAEIFSFPSGHTSRATFITYFFTILVPTSAIYTFTLFVWTFSLAFSRILLNRHYILDVLGGCFIGLMAGISVGYIWLN